MGQARGHLKKTVFSMLRFRQPGSLALPSRQLLTGSGRRKRNQLLSGCSSHVGPLGGESV